MTSNPKAISLFSGMGGDSLGLQNAGFDVIAFNEFDKAAINTHKLNFPNSTIISDPSQKKLKTKLIYKLYLMLFLKPTKAKLILFSQGILVLFQELKFSLIKAIKILKMLS